MSQQVTLSLAFIFGCVVPWALGVCFLLKTAWDIFIFWLWGGIK